MSGSLAVLRPHPGPAPLLDLPALEGLRACLRRQFDAPLDELRIWLAALGGPSVSPATMVRAVQALD